MEVSALVLSLSKGPHMLASLSANQEDSSENRSLFLSIRGSGITFCYIYLWILICYKLKHKKGENISSNLQRKDFLFVGIQLALFVLYVIDFKLLSLKTYLIMSYFGLSLLLLGILIVLIALLQLNTNLSPFPSPKSNASLIKTGLYKFVRHPIYTGIIVATFGYGLYTGSLYRILISIGLYILFYFKSEYEEERLKMTFPEYKIYRESAGRFFPKF